jgi:hypothetical protein
MLNGINSCLGVTSALLVNVSSPQLHAAKLAANVHPSNLT